MDSTAFKYKHQYQQQNQHFNINSSSNNYNNNSNNHNNNNQNSIFILNTATNNILPNNPKLYYSDLNDNNVVSSPTSLSSSSASSTTASSSVWSSASSTMCSPAAHAIQKLFNCSSNSFKLNHGNYSGIESKTFKSKSELLKKKSKFWKYLEGEANDKNIQRGIDAEEGTQKKLPGKSLKLKSKYWSKSYENDNQNQQDLSELLEYSCSLCDNCRCMDCQIGYFDCENSDDSNSEYSFHLSAYEEDEDETNDADNDETHSDIVERAMELKTSVEAHSCLEVNCCNKMDNKQQTIQKLRIDSKIPPNCSISYCACNELNCTKAEECCPQCYIESVADGEAEMKNQPDFVTTSDHH